MDVPTIREVNRSGPYVDLRGPLAIITHSGRWRGWREGDLRYNGTYCRHRETRFLTRVLLPGVGWRRAAECIACHTESVEWRRDRQRRYKAAHRERINAYQRDLMRRRRSMLSPDHARGATHD